MTGTPDLIETLDVVPQAPAPATAKRRKSVDIEMFGKVVQDESRPLVKKAQIIPWKSLQIDNVIAQGSFGAISKGKYNQVEVAIKTMLPGNGNTADMMEDLVLEVETMRTLKHANLLSTIGITSDFESQFGLVMEFMPTTFFHLLHSPLYRKKYGAEMNWRCCFLALLADVAAGMSFLHGEGLVHRDLKPHNILVSSAWVAKVADFGEVVRTAGSAGATVKAQSQRASQRRGSLVNQLRGSLNMDAVDKKAVVKDDAASDHRVHGSAPYMSPEAASAGTENEVATGPPADVFGFGCMMAHISARKPPYVDVVKSAEQVIESLRNGTAKPLSALTDKNTPKQLREICENCCQWDPAKRPTFKELVGVLSTQELAVAICGEFAQEVDDINGNERLEACRPGYRLQWLEGEKLKEKKAATGRRNSANSLITGARRASLSMMGLAPRRASHDAGAPETPEAKVEVAPPQVQLDLTKSDSGSSEDPIIQDL